MKMLQSLGLLVLIAITFTACAARNDVLILDERLSSLESKLQRQQSALQNIDRTTDAKEIELRSQSANLRVEIDTLRQELQVLSGRIEEIEFRINQQLQKAEQTGPQISARVDQLQETVRQTDNRLDRIEQYLDMGSIGSSPAAAAAGAVAGAVAGTAASPPDLTRADLSEKELYNLSKEAFDKGDLDSARKGFEEFIRRFPKSDNADNAQFWIGEIYYKEKWYEKAIVEYQKVIENYPQGNKIKAALLKQGYAFDNIDDKHNAQLVLKELIRKYPESQEAEIAKRKLSQSQ